MDVVESRRGDLATTANPDQRHDYVISLSGVLSGPAPLVTATLRYVPDRLVLKPGAFSAYLAVLSAQRRVTLEALATTMLDDVNNEIIPRWAHVSIGTVGDAGGERHAVDAEDRRPDWDNPSLLARLAPI